MQCTLMLFETKLEKLLNYKFDIKLNLKIDKNLSNYKCQVKAMKHEKKRVSRWSSGYLINFFSLLTRKKNEIKNYGREG